MLERSSQARGSGHFGASTSASLGWTLVAVGALVPLLIGRSIKERIYGSFAVVPLGVVEIGPLAAALTAVGLN